MRVSWPVGSAPNGGLPGLPGRPRRAPPLGKLFRHGVLVKTHPRLLWEGNYLPGLAAPGISAMAAARSAGLQAAILDVCSSRPVRWE